ncbi:hypothetical protein RND71_035974 [Anisodus tanguticus]|uniref:Beta-fructofuranosidase n=1 Tax=Anisodus tanguticus TaxID=243964 RepID=A0AAE1R6M9_9SOLA|nr:hypothetical protein RND71_035974 [Anisodus tanguticus]
MYYNGVYHLFYQYNPYGSVWGNIVWAHSVSTDLINWIPLEPAIYPSKVFDKYGTWSGSATILPDNKLIILYTGIVDANQTQVQNYAIPADLSDPFLRKWIKPDNNPLIVGDTSINKTQFRDPTTAWLGRDVLLHGTNGLDASSNGKNVKHVLKVSLDVTRFEYYTVGTYDTKKDIYIPDNTSIDGWKGLRLDYGNYYASKSFYDPSKNRRIVWGWANESDTVDDDIKKGWAGIQTIPRKLWLDPSGKQLVQWPIEELENLREKKVHLSNCKLNNGDTIEVKGITPAQADVEVTFSFSSLDKAEPFDPSWADLYAQEVCAIKGSTVQGGLGPFGLLTLASEKLEEYTPIDHSVVESFGDGGKTCITSRVYPTLATYDNAHLFAFNNGTEAIKIKTLKAWSMGKPKMNGSFCHSSS